MSAAPQPSERRPRLHATLQSAAAILLMLANPSNAQTPIPLPDDQPPAIPTLQAAPANAPALHQLDFLRLLTDPRVLDDRVDDPVWELEEVEGRTPILLPVRVQTSPEPTTLGRPDASLSGARFIGWWIPPIDAPGNNPADRFNRPNPDDFAQQPRFIAGDSRFAHLLGDPNTDPTRGALQDQNPTTALEPATPGPRFARDLTVQPDGTLTWGLDRSFQGAQLQTGDNLYTLKLDPARLREQQPERPQRLTRNANESAREFGLRQREAQQQARAEQNAFRELRSQIQDLPETFAAPLNQLPDAVIYAVYQRPDNRPTLTFEGNAPDLPWSVNADVFQALRSLASSSGRGAGTPDDKLNLLQQAADDPNPNAAHATALALAGSGWLNQAQPGDPVFTLTQKLILGPHPQAARTAIQALADVDPPNPTSRRLLDIAARTDDPLAKLAALSASLRSSADNPAAVLRILQQADAVLVDPQGPPPDQVLAALAGNPDASPRNRRSNLSDVTRQALMLVGFDAMPPDRRTQAIQWVVSHAHETDSLAAGWLDVQLLNPDQPDLLNETLKTLNNAQRVAPPNPDAPNAAPASEPRLAEGLGRLIFGNPEPGSTQPPTPKTPQLQIYPPPLQSDQHQLFQALNHPNPDTQAAAWNALSKFTLAPDRSSQASSPEQIFDRLLLANNNRSNPDVTPQSLLDFLTRALQNQNARPDATLALLRLLPDADPDAARRLVATLLPPAADPSDNNRRNARDLSNAFNQLDAPQRVAFANAVYQASPQGPTPVAKLAAHEPAATWFAQQLDQGQLPKPGQWLEPLGDETRALDLAASDNDDIAHGTLAALAAAIGADPDAQQDVIQQLGSAPRSADELQVAWPTLKRELILEQINDAVGEYRFTLAVTQNATTNPNNNLEPDTNNFADPADQLSNADNLNADADANPDDLPINPVNLTLGIVELYVDQNQVGFTGDPITLDIPENAIALRIDDLLQLNNFPNPDVQAVPLQQANPPLDLNPQPNGTWRGETPLGPEHTLTLTLTLQPSP